MFGEAGGGAGPSLSSEFLPHLHPPLHMHTRSLPATQVHYSRTQLGCFPPTQAWEPGVGNSLTSMPPSTPLTCPKVGGNAFPVTIHGALWCPSCRVGWASEGPPQGLVREGVGTPWRLGFQLAAAAQSPSPTSGPRGPSWGYFEMG